MSMLENDGKYIWHPFTQMKTDGHILPISHGKGALLYDENGKEYIDGIASWWVNLHGHSHPYIADFIHKQLLTLEHVVFAGCTHEPATTIASRLKKHLPSNQQRFFFSDNGSTAVEIAMKMAIQYWSNQAKGKCKIIALENAYHGDTFGAMSAGGRGIFNAPFHDFMFEVSYLPFPAAGAESKTIEALKKELADGGVHAFIFEPLIQGAGGMQMYSPEVLDELIGICKSHQVLCIADEVMTGFGRTGSYFASNKLSNQPDIMCLSKGLTGGVLPMSLTTCSEEIYEVFLSDSLDKALLHGHSFTGNPVGCAAALASLDLLESKECQNSIARIAKRHQEFAAIMADNPKVTAIRQTGTIIAMDINSSEDTGYANSIRKELYREFLNEGVLLRPLGNVIYILPPYCIEDAQLDKIYGTIVKVINRCVK